MSSTVKISTIKKNILITVFSMIIFTAHPTPLTYPVSHVFWTYLYMAGLNVFMKPFTSDMIFMYDSQLKKSLYRYDLRVTYFTDTGEKQIDVRNLPFHRWRIPFTWFAITAINGEDVTPIVYTLCEELSRSQGPGSGFMINSNAEKDISSKYGLNKTYKCDTDAKQ